MKVTFVLEYNAVLTAFLLLLRRTASAKISLEVKTMEIEDLTEDQKEALKAWVASGDYIAESDGSPSLSDFDERYRGVWPTLGAFALFHSKEITQIDPEDRQDRFWTAPTGDGEVYVFERF